jgi:tetratricopeptide (TPR) repeat protein
MVCLAVWESAATRQYIGHWQDVVSLYDHMLRITPRASPLYVDVGIVLSKQGKTSQAVDCYRKALKLEPDQALGHFNLAVELAKSKEGVDEAISHYQQVLGHSLVGNRAYLCLSVLLKGKGQTGQAIKLMQTALRMNPEEFRTHLCLGETLPLVGESREGVYHLREAIRLAPGLAPGEAGGVPGWPDRCPAV